MIAGPFGQAQPIIAGLAKWCLDALAYFVPNHILPHAQLPLRIGLRHGNPSAEKEYHTPKFLRRSSVDQWLMPSNISLRCNRLGELGLRA